jgi:hypothetical protein
VAHASAPKAIGEVKVPYGKHPDFDVLADELHSLIHFVYRNDATLYYMKSADGGEEWTAPASIGEGQSARLAVDTGGTIHMAYATGGRKEDKSWYRQLSGDQWSEPTPVTSLNAVEVIAPRIAVDGSNGVHVIGWMFPKIPADKDWKEYTRCLYMRKPAGQIQFEAPEEFGPNKHPKAFGGGGSGDIFVDPNGDVHIAYTCWTPGWMTTHFVRSKEGKWKGRIDLWRSTTSDFCLSGAVDKDGVVHLSGFDVQGKNPPMHWAYFNNSIDRQALTMMHGEDEDWELGTDLLLTPEGDIWISSGNWSNESNFNPLRGRIMHYNAKSKKWSKPEDLSVKGFRNLDGRHGQTPKFIYYGGKVRVFYAEGKPQNDFTFFQKLLQ